MIRGGAIIKTGVYIPIFQKRTMQEVQKVDEKRCKRLGYCDNSVPPISEIFSE